MEEQKAKAADADLRSRIAKLPWHHQIEFGNGILTHGNTKIEVLRAQADIYFKSSVRGRSVLDIGCWDGFNSFDAHRRGAARSWPRIILRGLPPAGASVNRSNSLVPIWRLR